MRKQVAAALWVCVAALILLSSTTVFPTYQATMESSHERRTQIHEDVSMRTKIHGDDNSPPSQVYEGKNKVKRTHRVDEVVPRSGKDASGGQAGLLTPPADRMEQRDNTPKAADDEVGQQYALPSHRIVDRALGGRHQEGDVHCVLSRYAQSSAFSKKLRSACAMCDNTEGSGNQSITPSLCRDDVLGEAERNSFHVFSRRPSEAVLSTLEIPERPAVVFCAIGLRFEGPGGQAYVWEAIHQWRLFNPPSESIIYLILSDEVAANKENIEKSERYTVELVRDSTLRNDRWRRYERVFYIQGYMHPGGNRQTGNKKFNQYVSQRFFALQSLIEKKNLKHVLHLENDIMTYGNWKTILPAIARCGVRLASTTPSTKGVIPGMLYVRDGNALAHLDDFVNDLLSCKIKFGKTVQKGYANDMTYLMNYYQLYGAEFMGALPAWEHKKGENCMYDNLVASSIGSALFDAASFGQWYSFIPEGGREPPQHKKNAMKGRFLDATPPPLMTWEKDDQGRRVPKWKGYKLLSLHIHSKGLEKFRS